MEMNDKRLEKASNTAIPEVTSSMMLASALLIRWIEVITIRQNPKRFDEVLRMY